MEKNDVIFAFVSMTLSTGRRACRDATMVGKLMGNSMARPCFDGFGDNLTSAPLLCHLQGYLIGWWNPSRKLMVQMSCQGLTLPLLSCFFFHAYLDVPGSY